MPMLPDFETFCRLAPQANLVPVYRRLVDDTLTPVTAFHKLDRGEAACLFESVIGGERVGRFSFLTAEPYLQLSAYDRQVTVVTRRAGEPQVERYQAADPLAELQRRMQGIRTATLPELPPFCGGAVGYAGYDTVRYTERLPHPPPDDRLLPDMAFGLYDSMVVFDHIHKTLFVIALARTDGTHPTLRAAYDEAAQRVDELVDRLAVPITDMAPSDIDTTGQLRLSWTSNFPRPQFEAAVQRCLEYIRAGDIFQVVLSQRLQVPLRVPPFEVYRTLRVVNPSPFMFYLRQGDLTLVGSSPEIMVRVVGDRVTTRPLAGTRPRGATPDEDRRLAEELLADPKERAEHVMLVDLGRNDVGRVARYGSVTLEDVMTIERYSHVMHIASTVHGRLREDQTAFDALRACLPAGTLSGAPKVRAMEIIDELEPHRRGPYAGAVGYIDFSGNMDTCIALRTMVIKDGTVYIQAGAGIVADSIPANEYQETLNKALGLLKAVEITERRMGT
jgi:anthranilate synthase component 1